jgi:hypothetical protein
MRVERGKTSIAAGLEKVSHSTNPQKIKTETELNPCLNK